ncbi:MAG TPA: hypothetical protein VGJ35_09300, partial [Burkholderiaceae bacterium]
MHALIGMRLLSRLLVACAAALCVTSQAAPPLHPRELAARPEQPVRLRESFNAGWRFHLGDAVGAHRPDFQDADWQTVGLPHSFSIPYFQSAAFHVGYGWYRK